MLDKIYKLTILILLLVVAGFLLFGNSCKGKETEQSKTDTTYLKATHVYHTLQTINNPVPYKVEVPGAPGATITIPAVVDSGAVVRDYFTKRHYSDSLYNDSVTVYLQEEVYKNELKRIKTGYKWHVPTMIIKKTIIQEKQLVFLGAEPHGNQKEFGMYVSADFDTNRALWGYGFDPFTMQHKISIKGKLRLWNKKQ